MMTWRFRDSAVPRVPDRSHVCIGPAERRPCGHREMSRNCHSLCQIRRAVERHSCATPAATTEVMLCSPSEASCISTLTRRLVNGLPTHICLGVASAAALAIGSHVANELGNPQVASPSLMAELMVSTVGGLAFAVAAAVGASLPLWIALNVGSSFLDRVG